MIRSIHHALLSYTIILSGCSNKPEIQKSTQKTPTPIPKKDSNEENTNTTDFDPRKYRSYGNDADPPTDTSGSISALAALKGTSGLDATPLMVNGVSGSRVDFGLPVYVQLKGSLDQGKSTRGVTGLVAHKLGNSLLGVIQSYANSGTGVCLFFCVNSEKGIKFYPQT